MLHALMTEVEAEVLEERLAEQEVRLAEREKKLAAYDSLRQKVEYEKATLRAEAREQQRQEEMEAQLALIEAHEETQRQLDIEREKAAEAAALQARVAGMTPEQREAFIADLEELAALEEKLVTTTETLEQRQEAMKQFLAQQEAAKDEQRKVLEAFCEDHAAERHVLEEYEEAAVASLAEYAAGLRERVEGDAKAAAEEASRRALAKRRAAVAATLSEADTNHLNTLTEEQRNVVLDELHELQELKSRFKRHSTAGASSSP